MNNRPRLLLAVCLLLAPLVLPQLLDLLGVSEGQKAQEKRAKTSRPPAILALTDFKAYARQVTSAYADTFPFRDLLIRTNNALRLAVFHESPAKSVIVGRDGWLFNNLEYETEDWLNLWTISEAELDKAVAVQTARRDWLAARGIAHLVVIAPSKSTIYGEFLPPGYHKLREHSRLDRLADRLTRAGIDFVDLRPALFAAKAVRQAYWKTDTHWNDWGALMGSAAVVDALRKRLPNLPPVDVAGYRPEEVTIPGGDLSVLLLLENTLTERFTRMVPTFIPQAKPGPPPPYTNPATLSGRDMIVRETGNPSLPRALFFRDSFSSAAYPFLAENFSRSVFIWDHRFLTDIILAEKPDVVVLEAVERYLNATTIDNPPLR